MSGSADRKDEEAWWGRPQDDPALRAALEKRFADYRREHPPVNCWIDRVQTTELYLEGVRRALVDRSRALIMVYDANGVPASSVVYLRSECSYDVAEAHLGIERVAEVRDESDEAVEILSAVPREREERNAQDYRRKHSPDAELFHYLRAGLALLTKERQITGIRPGIMDDLQQAIIAENEGLYEQALALLRKAAAALESRPPDRMFGDPALAACRCAIEAIERQIAVRDGRLLPRGAEGKSGG